MSTKLPNQIKATEAQTTSRSGGRLLQRKCACGQHTMGGSSCAECNKGKELQRKKAAPHAEAQGVPTIVHQVLSSQGQSLDTQTRSFMESRFGHDFSQVRVHTDSRAAESAQAVNALAYTVGRNIVLGAGQYRPETSAGRRLLAHELTHVVQQQTSSHAGAMTIGAETSPAESEADRVSRNVMSGEMTGAPLSRVRETTLAGQMNRVSQSGSSSSTSTSTPASSPAAPKPAATTARVPRQRIRLDILGADMSVKDAIVRSAAQTLDTDMRVTSLEDMIAKLDAEAGPNTSKCVEKLNIYNHGSPGGQQLVGSETIRSSDGRTIKFPYSGLTLNWLLNSGNQTSLDRLRNVFCCDAAMQWLGCGTAGVQATGGVRTDAERSESRLRYADFGDRYKDPQDAAAHGASLMGATFGNLNIQSWADATCTSITASTDFTYFTPKTPGQLYRAGHGGKFVAFPPRDAVHCACDPQTGRPRGAWSINEAKSYNREQEKAATGDNYLWHQYLKTFHAYWKLRNNAVMKHDVLTAFGRLIQEAAAGTTVPGSLPKGDVHPWLNIGSVNPTWAAFTSPHLVFCFPDNCWRWITVNQTAIETTPNFTQHVLGHELLHAADMWAAAQDYKSEYGNPPAGAGARCVPASEGVRKGWTDDWGQYINAFFDFYEGRMTAMRHEEIYDQAVASHWDKLAAHEKIVWLAGVLQNIPPNLPANKTFDAEQRVLRIFKNPRPEEIALRDEIAALLGRITAETILGDDKKQGIDLGKGRSLLNHFQPVWRLIPQRSILIEAIKLG